MEQQRWAEQEEEKKKKKKGRVHKSEVMGRGGGGVNWTL